jgi:hypothetical protein
LALIALFFWLLHKILLDSSHSKFYITRKLDREILSFMRVSIPITTRGRSYFRAHKEAELEFLVDMLDISFKRQVKRQFIRDVVSYILLRELVLRHSILNTMSGEEEFLFDYEKHFVDAIAKFSADPENFYMQLSQFDKLNRFLLFKFSTKYKKNKNNRE